MTKSDVSPPTIDAPASKSAITRRAFLGAVAATAGGAALAACSAGSGAPSTSIPPSIAATTASLPAASAALDVRMITPPKLDTAYLGEHILCYRPLRKGKPNLSVETIGDTVVAHNYGHGGSGWTLGPGSAKYVIDLVEASPAGAKVKKDSPITIVGAGVIGLFTAYELVQRGYTNITVKAAAFKELTSHNAGGLLAPVSMDNDPEFQKIIDKIGIDAYKFYAEIANGTQPDFKTGAKVIPAYFKDREHSGLEPYVGNVMQPAKDVVLDFCNGTTRKMVSYDDGIFMDTAVLMKSLHDYLEPKMPFVQEKITDLNSLGSPLVFDCSGLGAAKLNDDTEVVSVQGHLVMLRDQTPADLQHMILVYFKEGTTEAGQHVKRSFYMFPKHLPGTGVNDVGVVGGTFVEGGTPLTPNYQEFDTMIAAARNFYGM